MLVLSRKIGEQVLVPELGIYITVLSAGTNRVQLGIEAPREIQITRPEANRPATLIEGNLPTSVSSRTTARGFSEAVTC